MQCVEYCKWWNSSRPWFQCLSRCCDLLEWEWPIERLTKCPSLSEGVFWVDVGEGLSHPDRPWGLQSRNRGRTLDSKMIPRNISDCDQCHGIGIQYEKVCCRWAQRRIHKQCVGWLQNLVQGPKMEYCRCKYSSSSYDPLRVSHNSPTLFKLLRTLTSWVLSLQYCKPIDSAWEQVNTQHTSSNTHNCYIIDSFPGPACPASHYLQYWERW